MEPERRPTQRPEHLARLLYVLGALLLLLAACSQVRVVRWFEPGNKLMTETLDEIGRTRWQFALAGLMFGAAAWNCTRSPLAQRLFERRWIVRVVLFALFLWLPLFVLEGVLRPFAERHTTIFVRDDELGWKLRPLAEDYWSGTPVKINSRGLRGPEYPYAKPAGTTRVLFLGDSVTFGFAVLDDDDTLPAQVEALLARELERPVECINGGVDGYSTWQELAFLEREGLRYEPDLVVLCFVLNDVDERFRLKRWGGTGEGFQLARTLSEDGLHVIETSSILHFVHRLTGRLRFGHDVAEGARVQQAFDTYDIMLNPNRDDVQAAWKATLKDLEALIAACRGRELPLLLVIFPYATQLYRPELNSPQWILERFCGRRDLPFLDLMPPLLAAVARGPLAIEDLYIDPIHTRAEGDRIAAEEITQAIVERALLPAK